MRRGFTLIETLVGTAVMLTIFVGLIALLRVSIQISVIEKVEAGANSIAESQMEHLRGLSYDSLGTLGGIPAGLILQSTTTTLGGVDYNVRTFIAYTDDPADGLGAADANGITTDYKLAKVTVSYSFYNLLHSVSLVSDFVPPSLETSTGGGTLQASVVDSHGAPLSGAAVHIVNALLSPTVDLTTFSNTAGIVYLSGAATSSDYQITVTKTGYSSAQTYARTAQNVNPNPGYLTVAKDQTTTSTFAIDHLATLALSTFAPPTLSTWSDTFANDSKIAATSSVSVASGSLQLDAGQTVGSVRAVSFAPALLYQWGSVGATLATSTNTSATVQVFDGAGTPLPDAVLPGNSVGFSVFPLDLSGVSTSSYPSLALGSTLQSSSGVSPTIDDWSLSALTGPTPLPNVSFTLTGTKTIGTDGSGSPIYKNVVTDSTGASASKSESLEWDAYALTTANYDVVDACAIPPYSLSPGNTVHASLTLGDPSSNRVLVTVLDASGNVVPGATVQVTKTGFSSSQKSSYCGNAYFGNLSATSYTITISKTGYTTTAVSNVSVSGQTYVSVAFP